MEAIWQWGLDFIRTIQQVHRPALDAIFKALTFMGEKEFSLIFFTLIFWCVDFAVGVRLVFVYLISPYVNTLLKHLFAHPRPFELDPTVQRHFTGLIGSGMPSGHAQSAVVIWGSIAVGFRKTWLWIVAILLIVLIGFSRVYLGVHFPTDVLGGWAVGAVVLAIYLALEPHVEARLKRAEMPVQLALAAGAPLVLLLLYRADDVAIAMATMLGMGVGLVLGKRVAPFSTSGPLWQRSARYLVGVIGLLAIYLGLKLVFPSEGEPFYPVMRIVRYVLVGLWGGLGAPWLFRRLRLASNETL
jgi:membrane-associated phospholipid phosphatase